MLKSSSNSRRATAWSCGASRIVPSESIEPPARSPLSDSGPAIPTDPRRTWSRRSTNVHLKLLDAGTDHVMDTRDVQIKSNVGLAPSATAATANSKVAATDLSTSRRSIGRADESPWTEVEFRFRPEKAGRMTLRV